MKADRLNPGSKERVAPQVIVNNSVNQPPPRPPSAGALPRSTAGGRVLEGTQPAPLLVLARFGTNKQLTKNKSRRVTPFWHNDTRSRVTVTFGARRAGDGRGAKGYVVPEVGLPWAEWIKT
jgi:hypothetical protein